MIAAMLAWWRRQVRRSECLRDHYEPLREHPHCWKEHL